MDEKSPQLTDAEIGERVKYHVQRYHLSRGSMMGFGHVSGVAEFREAIDRLRFGDASAAVWGIAFLAERPYHFRSGYLKNDLIRYLRRIELTEPQRQRLRDFIVSVLQHGDRLNSKGFRALARRLDSKDFRARLKSLAESDDPWSADAAQTLRNCEMNDYREDMRGAR